MEYVSLLAGEEWSDRPACTHPLLAHEARLVNDLLSDDDRSRLVPLIGRLLGTAADSDEISARLRLRQARQVLLLVDPDERGPVNTVIARAESWLEHADGTEDDVQEAVATARRYPIRRSDLDPEHVAFHVQAARTCLSWVGVDTGPKQAWAVAAFAAAHSTAATDCRADCGDTSARARRMVKDLAGLIEEHEAATARTPEDLTVTEVRALIDAVG